MMVEITWYVLKKLEKFKQILQEKHSGLGFFHSLMTYAPNEQKYGREYFTNLEEIMNYWSDVIDIQDWGKISHQNLNGGYRTFFYGTVQKRKTD